MSVVFDVFVLPRSMLAGAIFALVMPLSAFAQSAGDLVDGSDPSLILDIAQGYGSAMLDVDGVGDHKISGRMDGQAYNVRTAVQKFATEVA